MNLYEIKPLKKLPRKEKKSKEIKAVMNQVYDIIADHWAFIGGYEKKGDAVRVLADFDTFHYNITSDFFKKIKSHKLNKIGVQVV